MTISEKIVICALLSILSIPFSNAQCNRIIKKLCTPALKPYINNGQLHTTVLKSEGRAVVKLSLNKGLRYRIAICKSESDVHLNYQLTNKFGRVFNEAKFSENSKTIDFTVNESANYELHLTMLNENAAESINSSCVSVLVGFK